MNLEKLKEMTNEQLIQFYRDRYPIPRKCKNKFSQPKFQIEQRIDFHLKSDYFEIIKEAVEIEKVPGTICMFCLMQLLKIGNILYNRLTYKFLMLDGKMKFGQYSLMASESTIKRLFKQYYNL